MPEDACPTGKLEYVPFVAQKTILIERVSNGWIVRPFQPVADHCWTHESVAAMAVYTDIEKLQADLPKLIWSDYIWSGNPSRPVNQ